MQTQAKQSACGGTQRHAKVDPRQCVVVAEGPCSRVVLAVAEQAASSPAGGQTTRRNGIEPSSTQPLLDSITVSCESALFSQNASRTPSPSAEDRQASYIMLLMVTGESSSVAPKAAIAKPHPVPRTSVLRTRVHTLRPTWRYVRTWW